MSSAPWPERLALLLGAIENGMAGAVMKGILRDHLRADERALAKTVFPGSEAVKPLGGLIA